jgi:nicotinate-nucleotide adenylyltransferase
VAFPGERIGLLGGSFNPPHAAHVLASRTAIARLGLARVWWLVSPGNPLKSHDELRPLSERVAACKRIIGHLPIVVTSFEGDLGTSRTAATLAALVHRRSGVHFVWLMGADNLATFHRWGRWRDIAAVVPLAVIDRPRWRLPASSSPAARALAESRVPEARARLLADRMPPAWTMLTTRLSGLSSTEIRSRRG